MLKLISRLGALLLLFSAVLPLAAAAAPRQEWKVASFTWVKLLPREAGSAPNDQPAALTAVDLRDRLAEVRYVSTGGSVPLLDPKELSTLLEPLVQAFAAAGPDQDLQVLTTYKREGTFFQTAKAATLRLFHQGGAVQVIIHDARKEFLSDYVNSGTKPNFTFGSRTVPGEVEIRCAGAVSLRPDWLRFPDPAAAPVSGQAAAPPAAAPAPGPAAIAPAPAPAATAPAEAGEPGASASATAAGTAAPANPAWDHAGFEAKEQHLKDLKRLREENLLSEDEYQELRKKALADL